MAAVEDSRGVGGSVATADLTFAIVPEWVIDLDVSDRAFRLYAVLARYADSDGTNAIPSRRRLAQRLRCSVDTIDRAAAELIDAGAVERQHRYDSGRQTSNGYYVRRIPPGHGGRTDAAHPRRTDAAPPGRTDAAPVPRTSYDREPEDRDTPSPDGDSACDQPTLADVHDSPAGEDPTTIDAEFEAIWQRYPKRRGKRVGKKPAREKFRRHPAADRAAIATAVDHYAAACLRGDTIAMDMQRFVAPTNRLWEDWLEPPDTTDPSSAAVRSGRPAYSNSMWDGHESGGF